MTELGLKPVLFASANCRLWWIRNWKNKYLPSWNLWKSLRIHNSLDPLQASRAQSRPPEATWARESETVLRLISFCYSLLFFIHLWGIVTTLSIFWVVYGSLLKVEFLEVGHWHSGNVTFETLDSVIMVPGFKSGLAARLPVQLPANGLPWGRQVISQLPGSSLPRDAHGVLDT